MGEMQLNTKFYLSSSIGVARIKWQKNEKLQNAKFHENWLKNRNFKKILLNPYIFWLLNSIPKMNFLSQKMVVQSLVIFNRDYIAKNSKIGIILSKMKNSKI